MRVTVIALLAIAVGLFVYNPVTFANHGGSTATPWHSDAMTVNATDGIGVNGGLLASPPGSCTAVPDGLAGDCHRRAEAATDDWLNGKYAHGKGWSDLENAAVPAFVRTNAPPKSPQPIGGSWIPEYCNQPSCGHLLKGDVLEIDENGDGRFDNTWIDDGDGVKENGEVDRLRAEQFGWGATSVIIDFNNLGSPSNPQIVLHSGVSPPGLARARVRVALGDDPDCENVFSSDCQLSGVIAMPGSVPDDVDINGDLNNPNDKSSTIDNNGFYGICDPDRFAGSLVSIQQQLDNCLWKVGSTPVTAPGNSSVTGQGNAIRTEWIGQQVTKFTWSNTPNRQDFFQRLFLHYGFQSTDPISGSPVPVDEALYQNAWFLEQTDFDPNRALNFRLVDVPPGSHTLESGSSLTPDTYNSTFRMQHTSLGRRYGFDFSGNPIGPDPGDTLLDPSLIGKTNPTDDPFWGAEAGPLGFNTDFNTNAKSGVGQATGLRFLYVQEVEGSIVHSCFNCTADHPPLTAPQLIYQFNWEPTGGVGFTPHETAISGATGSIP